MVPRILVTYCFCVKSSSWSSDCYSNEQQKCFDSSAPVSTVNVIRLDDIQVGSSDVDYTVHYERERCGGTNVSNTVFPFYSSILPITVGASNCLPRSSSWAEEKVGEAEEVFWSLETSKLFR